MVSIRLKWFRNSFEMVSIRSFQFVWWFRFVSLIVSIIFLNSFDGFESLTLRLLSWYSFLVSVTFDGFDTICLEFKIVNHMTGQHGRKRSFSSFCVTGNGKGLAGFGLAKAPTGMGSLRVSKNKAGQQLVFIERYEDHTGECNSNGKFFDLD